MNKKILIFVIYIRKHSFKEAISFQLLYNIISSLNIFYIESNLLSS